MEVKKKCLMNLPNPRILIKISRMSGNLLKKILFPLEDYQLFLTLNILKL